MPIYVEYLSKEHSECCDLDIKLLLFFINSYKTAMELTRRSSFSEHSHNNSHQNIQSARNLKETREEPNSDKPDQGTEEPLLSKEPRVTYRSRVKITFMIINIALSSFYFGYCVVYFGQLDTKAMLHILNYDQLNTSVAKGLLNGCIPVGALIGALTSSFLLKNLSRRNCLLIINLCAFIVGGLIYIQNFYSLLIFRFCQGIFVGMYSAISPLIINELAPTEISGSLGSFTQLFVSFGVFFGCIFAYALKKITGDQTGKDFWEILYGFTEITIFLQTIGLLFIFPFETPTYLLSVGREEEAKKLIEVIYKDEYVDEILNTKKEDLKALQAKESLLTSSVASEKEKGGKRNFIPIIIALNLAILQQLSGVNAITVYAGNIANNITSPQVSELMSSIVNFQSFLGTFITGFLLAKFGRKTILQVGTLFQCLANFLVAVGFFIEKDTEDNILGEALILTGLFLYTALFGVSLGPVVWLYIPEVVEAKFVPFTTAANWICASIVIILFPILTDNVLDENPAILFLFFGGYCLCSFIFHLKFLVESKDKNHSEIQEKYDELKLC